MENHRPQTSALESTLGLAFCAVADLLASYETSRDSWRQLLPVIPASVNSFPSAGEMFLLKDKNLHTVSQLLVVNNLTGGLTRREQTPPR
jgi:hypothetical protein